jgi:hypothetical protein
MNKYKRITIYLSCIGIICVLFGTTYSFFNYARNGLSNTIGTGRIEFNSEQGQGINLINIFPIDVTNGIPNNENVGSVTIDVDGSTNYDKGIEYLILAENVNNTIGTGTNIKIIPISIDVGVTTLGEEDEDYFENRESTDSSIYKILASDTIQSEDELVVGYIKSGGTGIDGSIVIRAYVDDKNVAITDTYPLETTNNWANGRVVLTSTEWNNIQTNGISFQVKVVSNDGIWVDKPVLCKRVTDETKLHTEICNNEDTTIFCQADGYSLNSEVKYGNAKISGELETGDAFDCNVDGTGFNQRFYYVSDYYDTSTKEFDENIAVLVYYGSVNNGVVGYNTIRYSSATDVSSLGYSCIYTRGCNWYGPITANKNLPSVSQWNKIKLYKTGRRILGCQNGNCSIAPVEQTSGGPIDNPFNYSSKAARLLTLQEVIRGCKPINGNKSMVEDGSLTACNFLFEGTKYTDNNKQAGVWLENPRSDRGDLVWAIYTNSRRISPNYTDYDGAVVKPAIDVPYDMLEY